MNETESGGDEAPQTQEEGQYHAVALAALRLDTIAGFDTYIREPTHGTYVLYCGKDIPFTKERRSRLIEGGTREIHIHGRDSSALKRYVESNLGAILDDPGVVPEEKADLLYGSLVGVVEDVMHDPRAGDIVPRSKSIVENMCKFLYGQRGSLEFMMRVCSFDYYTYTHSVNVFVFAMAIGQRVFSEELVNGEYGMGALLHDIGKSRVSESILNCRGKLTNAQYAKMKMHTVFGYDLLKEKGGAGPLVLDMVRHHHERIGGSGYPDNLSGDAISKEVRCLTIADIFDALTTQRPYKDSMDSFAALKLMGKEMAEHLDPEFFRIFVEMMGNRSK